MSLIAILIYAQGNPKADQLLNGFKHLTQDPTATMEWRATFNADFLM